MDLQTSKASMRFSVFQVGLFCLVGFCLAIEGYRILVFILQLEAGDLSVIMISKPGSLERMSHFGSPIAFLILNKIDFSLYSVIKQLL